MQLMLTWQFFDQTVAMTRMRTGRVIHFDFSTEYDVQLTDDFLDYMKFVSMSRSQNHDTITIMNREVIIELKFGLRGVPYTRSIVTYNYFFLIKQNKTL